MAVKLTGWEVEQINAALRTYRDTIAHHRPREIDDLIHKIAAEWTPPKRMKGKFDELAGGSPRLDGRAPGLRR